MLNQIQKYANINVIKKILIPNQKIENQNNILQNEIKEVKKPKVQQNPKVIKGRQISRQILKEKKNEINNILENYQDIRPPKLSIILVGNYEGSISYVKNKIKACDRIGIVSELYHYNETVKYKHLQKRIFKLNKDNSVDSIMCQLPLPDHIQKLTLLSEIKPEKDVDCLQQVINFPYMKQQFQQQNQLPCTPNAIMEIFRQHKIQLENKRVVILGKGMLVGYPLTVMLLQQHAFVQTLDKYSKNIQEHVQRADIVISATGVRHLVKGEWIKEGAIVIDAGTNKGIEGVDKKRITGDVEYESALERASLITPVPGGVGPMTVAMLLNNVVEQWKCNIKQEYNLEDGFEQQKQQIIKEDVQNIINNNTLKQ